MALQLYWLHMMRALLKTVKRYLIYLTQSKFKRMSEKESAISKIFEMADLLVYYFILFYHHKRLDNISELSVWYISLEYYAGNWEGIVMMRIEDIIPKIKLWKGQSVSYVPLNGGLSNYTYKVNADDGLSYVLGICGGQNNFLKLDKSEEIKAIPKAHELGDRRAYIYGGKQRGLYYHRNLYGGR